LVKQPDKRIDPLKIDKFLPNMISTSFMDRERYDYRVTQFRKEKPQEYLQQKLALVNDSSNFKNVVDTHFINRKRTK